MSKIIYHCIVPRCTWTIEEEFDLFNTSELEFALERHINTHPIYRYIVKYRVWKLNRKLDRNLDMPPRKA